VSESDDKASTISAEGRDTPPRPPRGASGDMPAALAEGELVAGRYRVVKLLARGGMGEVYHAEDQELREPVALKLIRPEIANDPRTIKRFRREVQLARKVTHRNVCRCFDVGYHRVDGKPPLTFITMELLLGETLAQRLRQGRIPPAEATPLLRQMAAALDAAHRAGIVHRDFKSENVILVPSDDAQEGVRVVVTDFGVARALAGPPRRGSSLTAAGTKIGTPAYMAPEQLQGGGITARTDVYALGIVAYEMIAGALPFQGESRFATAMKRLSEAPPSPRVHCAELSASWEHAILRCLERDPAARFAHASDFVRALDGADVAAAPAGPRFGRRHVAGAVVLALAIAAAMLLLSRHLH
jgi:serine/threonine protein kinase